VSPLPKEGFTIEDSTYHIDIKARFKKHHGMSHDFNQKPKSRQLLNITITLPVPEDVSLLICWCGVCILLPPLYPSKATQSCT